MDVDVKARRMRIVRRVHRKAIDSHSLAHVRNLAKEIVHGKENLLRTAYVECWKYPVTKNESERPYGYCDVALVELGESNVKSDALVVTCVVKDEAAHDPVQQQRLYERMHDCKCEYGILMSASVAYIFKDNQNGGLDRISDKIDIRPDEEMTRLFAFIDQFSETPTDEQGNSETEIRPY